MVGNTSTVLEGEKERIQREEERKLGKRRGKSEKSERNREREEKSSVISPHVRLPDMGSEDRRLSCC